MITVRNKQELNDRIIEAKIGIKMAADILQQVKLFEHRKQVNKTFTDSFDALGYHAYINKGNWNSKLVIRKHIEDETHSKENGYTHVEFVLYEYISWENIKLQVERYNFASRLKEAEEALACFNDELKAFEEFSAYVEKQDFKCVDLWRIKSELKSALNKLKS